MALIQLCVPIYLQVSSFFAAYHPEGTSKVSCKCDFSKVSDFTGDVWDINYFSLKIF